MSFKKQSRRELIQHAASFAAVSMFSGMGISAQAETSLPPRAIGQPFPSGVTLPTSPPAKAKADSVGVALVGLGRYALRKMAPALLDSKHCHLAAVVSGNPKKAARVAKAYGLSQDSVYSYDNFAKIAKDERVAAVNIVLPTGLHADWTERAFAAGKHVLCEKPMAINAAECMRMIHAGERAKRKLMIGYRCHFEPNNLHAMQLMRDGRVGDIRMIRTDQHYVMGPTSPDTNWRVNRALAGGGALEDFGLYGLQAMLYLSGEMPIRVSATSTKPVGDPTFKQIPSLVATRFDFASGAVAQLSTSYNASWDDRVEVRGDEGVMLMQPATGYDGIRNRILRSKNEQEFSPKDATVQFAAMIDHFGEAIKSNTSIITGGAMGLRDMRLIDAIYTADKRGAPVELNKDGTIKKA